MESMTASADSGNIGLLGHQLRLHQAIQEVQQQLGRKVCLYVCAAEVGNATSGPNRSPLFNSSAEIREWSSVNPSGQERPAEAHSERAAPEHAARREELTRRGASTCHVAER